MEERVRSGRCLLVVSSSKSRYLESEEPELLEAEEVFDMESGKFIEKGNYIS